MGHRKAMAALKHQNKKFAEERAKSLAKCAICGFMPASKYAHTFFCKSHMPK